VTIVRELFGNANPIGEQIKINKVPFQVIGVLPEKGASWRDEDDVIVVPVLTGMHRCSARIMSIISTSRLPPRGHGCRARSDAGPHYCPPPGAAVAARGCYDVRNLADIQSAMSETSRTMSWLLAAIATISLGWAASAS